MAGKVGAYIRRNHLALLALFLAAGGTSAFAATKLLPANSVGTRQVVNHSLLKRDFKRGLLLRGAKGAPGQQGAKGDKGDTGAAGPGARKVDFDSATASVAVASKQTVLAVDELTLKAKCWQDTNVEKSVYVSLYVTSSVAARIDYAYLRDVNATSQDPKVGEVSLAAGVEAPLLTGPEVVAADYTTFVRIGGQFVYRNANRVITMTLYAIAHAGNKRCQVTGTAVPAPA